MITTVKPGAVDWTGDNPFIYLKTDPAGDWSTLAVYFRIALSPYGVGQAMLVLESPYQPEHADARRLVLTDNPSMTRYLLDNFVKKFGLFRPCTALLDSVRIVDGAQFTCEDTGKGLHIQRLYICFVHYLNIKSIFLAVFFSFFRKHSRSHDIGRFIY